MTTPSPSYQENITELYLPKFCVVPLQARLNKNIPDAAKIYIGELAVLTNKFGYLTYSDEQLAKMKDVSISTIERWHTALEKEGLIKRETRKEHFKREDGNGVCVRTKRKLYVTDERAQKETQAPDPSPPDPSETGGHCDPLKTRDHCDPSETRGNKYSIHNTELEEVLSVESVPVGSFPAKLTFSVGNNKTETLTNSEYFAWAARSGKKWSSDDMKYAWEALEKYKGVIHSWKRFVIGTIEKYQRQKKSANITKRKNGESKWKTNTKNEQSKDKSASLQEDTTEPMSEPLVSLGDLLKESYSGPKNLRTC